MRWQIWVLSGLVLYVLCCLALVALSCAAARSDAALERARVRRWG